MHRHLPAETTRTTSSLPLWLLGLCALLAGSGCTAHTTYTTTSTRPASGKAPSAAKKGEGQSASGTWDWIFRSTNEQGDLRVEQEEWHLLQQGSRLSGYYDRQVMVLSQDQRPFQCNGALGFTKNSRVRLSGEIHGGAVRLQEVAADAQPSPCDGGQRNLLSYQGELFGDSLLLRFPPGGTQYLTRRAAASATAAMAGSDGTPPADGPGESGGSLAGTWAWELSTVDAEGDLRKESEVWHLSEQNAELTGYYERSVHRTRPGGTFPCNGAADSDTLTRYTIRGQRFGDRLTISEIDYKAQPGPCDNALRRLDSYQGTIAPGGKEIVLSWGPGNQVLKRLP